MTANQLFRQAHQIARQVCSQYSSYREAFVVGLCVTRRGEVAKRVEKMKKTIWINHQPSGGREYVAEIVGTHPKWGLARSFLAGTRDWSSSGKTGFTGFEIESGKIYEVKPSWKDPYYVTLDNDGDIVEVSAAEAKEYAKNLGEVA